MSLGIADSVLLLLPRSYCGSPGVAQHIPTRSLSMRVTPTARLRSAIRSRDVQSGYPCRSSTSHQTTS